MTMTHFIDRAFFRKSKTSNGNKLETRMHSSRMRTVRCSSRHGGGVCTPPGAGTPPKQTLPREKAPTWPDPPQLPPWVWAWTRSPSTSPLGMGLETCKACWDTTPPPGDLVQDMLGYHLQCMLGYHPPVNRITDACENITLPQLHCGR